MTTAVRTAATKRPPMDSMRKTALVAGILYLITFISVATLTLYSPVLKDPAYILSSGSDAGLRWGALIEVIVALAGIGTAITLYPVVRRQNETFALGFVTSRVIEGAMLLTGVVSLLSLASLHQVGAAAGADSTALLTSGASFVGTYNAAFLIGGTLMPAMNALLLGYLMYRSSLVPRLIPAIGLVGGVLMTSSVIGQILGINEKISVWSLIALLPIFLWELSLGLWMTFKGFRKEAPLMVEAAAEAQARTDRHRQSCHRSPSRRRRVQRDRHRGAADSCPAASGHPCRLAAAPRTPSVQRGTGRAAGSGRQVRAAAPDDARAPLGSATSRDRGVLRGRPEPGHAGHERLGRGRPRVVAEPPGAAGHGRRVA